MIGLQADSLLRHHEVVTAVVYIFAALSQLAFMYIRPQQYERYRHQFAIVNRLARMLAPVLGSALATPATAARQIAAWRAAATLKMGPGLPASDAAVCVSGWSEAAVLPTLLPQQQAAYFALAKMYIMPAAAHMLSASWLVPWRIAVPIQLCTYAATVTVALSGLCVSPFCLDGHGAAFVLPGCRHISALVWAGAQLLDWHLPADAGVFTASSDLVCQQPLAVLVVYQLWHRWVLLVLVPCALIYSVERHLKSVFLRRQADMLATSAAAAAQLQQQQAVLQGPSSSARAAQALLGAGQLQQGQLSSTQHQHGLNRPSAALQEQQHSRTLDEVLEAVEPAPVGQILLSGAGFRHVRVFAGIGLAACALLVSYFVCEVGVLWLLHGGRQFVCDGVGWLHIA
jgi:hypothetical protein